MKNTVGMLLCMIALSSCAQSNQIGNGFFTIKKLPDNINLDEIPFEHKYPNYFFRFKDEIAAFKDTDKSLISSMILYKFTPKDTKWLVPDNDMKRGINESLATTKKLITTQMYFRRNETPYPYISVQKIVPAKDTIINKVPAVVGTIVYNYRSNVDGITRSQILQKVYMKEHTHYWSVDIFIADEKYASKYKPVFYDILKRIAFKRNQPEISGATDGP